MMSGSRKSGGFTLIELMIVVAIIAILAALAYSNYSRYSFRARRVDGKEFLARVAAAQERYYTNFNQYATSLTAAAPAGLAFSGPGADFSEKGYYQVATANGATGDRASFILTATPQPPQDQDACGALTLSDANVKTPAVGAMPQNSNGNCW